MTEEDFYAIAKTKPDVIRLFCNAVNAVIDMRKEAAQLQSGHWAGVRLKEKQTAAALLITEFADCFAAGGRPLAEDEKKLVQSWVVRAANFHLLREQGCTEHRHDRRQDDAGQAAVLGTRVT